MRRSGFGDRDKNKPVRLSLISESTVWVQGGGPGVAHIPQLDTVLVFPGKNLLCVQPPTRNHDPDSLLIAAGMMLGETGVERGARPGIYWETYGAPAQAAVSVELEVRREGGGLLDRVTRLVPGGAEGHGRLSWTEPSPGPEFRNSVVLDLEGLDSGKYTLRLRSWWPGQEPLETERVFEVR